MSIEIKVPQAGESVTSGLLATWLKEEGALVSEGEELYELETDKATIAVPAPATGTLKRLVKAGTEVAVGSVVGTIESAAAAPSSGPRTGDGARASGADGAAARAGTPPAAAAQGSDGGAALLSPAVRRVVEENDLDPHSITGTGKGGRITKGDALVAAQNKPTEATAGGAPQPAAAAHAQQSAPAAPSAPPHGAPSTFGPAGGERREPPRADQHLATYGATVAGGPGTSRPGDRQTRVAMTTIRKRIAERLVAAKQQAAHLTTFNEIDMSAVMELRARYKESFETKHGVKLGFMSFFVKASVDALREFPLINAILDGDDLVYNNFYDIGVAVASERGLVVPVIRDADRLGLAGLERSIADLARRVREKKITVDELTGGSFSITNGGVFGSLLSTPIPNFPQSAILGMHSIQKRPVVVGDAIVARPMMYVALTYDHRVVDGQGAVSFLVRIKQLIESPERLLLEV